jgi:hypothetical protein
MNNIGKETDNKYATGKKQGRKILKGRMIIALCLIIVQR